MAVRRVDAHSRASVGVVLLDALWVVPQPSHDGANADVRNNPERMRARPGGFRDRVDIQRQRRMRFSQLPPALSSFTTRGETDHRELTIMMAVIDYERTKRTDDRESGSEREMAVRRVDA
jgi:hypothetical protein